LAPEKTPNRGKRDPKKSLEKGLPSHHTKNPSKRNVRKTNKEWEKRKPPSLDSLLPNKRPKQHTGGFQFFRHQLAHRERDHPPCWEGAEEEMLRPQLAHREGDHPPDREVTEDKTNDNWTCAEPNQTQEPERTRTYRHTQPGTQPPTGDITIYTDGSAIPNPGPCGAGALFYLPEELKGAIPERIQASLGHGDNMAGEIWAIGMALKLVLESKVLQEPGKKWRIKILSDCSAAIGMVFQGWKAVKWIRLALQASLLLRKVRKKFMVSTEWIPSHVGIWGNEEADLLAKEAARSIPDQQHLLSVRPSFAFGTKPPRPPTVTEPVEFSASGTLFFESLEQWNV